MILLYVLLGLAALVLLLFLLHLIPAKLIVSFREQGSATVQYLFFRFDVKDLIEKISSDNEDKKDRTKKKAPTPSSQSKKADVAGFISFVVKVTRVLALAVKEQLEKSKVYLKEFELLLGTDDAANTALLYGAATTAANGLIAVLDRFTKLRCNHDKLLIAPNFSSDKTTFSIHFEIQFRFLHLVGVILRAQSRLFERKDVQHARNSVKTSH